MKTAHLDLAAALRIQTVEDVLYLEGLVEHFDLSAGERSRIAMACGRRAVAAYRAGYPEWSARLGRCARAALVQRKRCNECGLELSAHYGGIECDDEGAGCMVDPHSL